MRKTEDEEEGEREIGATDEAVLTANATIFRAIWEARSPQLRERDYNKEDAEAVLQQA